jgi:hypothetical protein
MNITSEDVKSIVINGIGNALGAGIILFIAAIINKWRKK